jgi:plasmid stability protein
MAVLDLRIPEEIKKKLAARAKGQHRNLSEQARRYIELAIAAEENPDLPFSFIEGIFEAKAEKELGLVEEVDWSI